MKTKEHRQPSTTHGNGEDDWMQERKPATDQEEEPRGRRISIPAPHIDEARLTIIGTAPLVIHRFSAKTKNQLKTNMETGPVGGRRRKREATDTDDLFEASRYRAKQGWDGFHAAAIRLAMIAACRLVDYKMTLAKMSLFVVADGWDATEPQIPLVRILGAKATKQEDMARVSNGNPYVTVRAAYHDWRANLVLRYDADQFTLDDVSNLLMRAGQQVGICEGRPFSKDSAGMGWGTFKLEGSES